MSAISFTSLAVVAVAAFVAPLLAELISAANAAAAVAAGLFSVLLFPLGALALLGSGRAPAAEGLEQPTLGFGR